MNTIILQNYNDLLKKVIFDVFSSNLRKEIDKMDINGNVTNYISLLSNLDESLCNIAKESLITIFESLDKAFSISTERKSKYYIKSRHERTIMTIFGEITYKRNFYQSKVNNKLFCYVDRLLGLHKYDYFDPYLKAVIVEYSANNSMPKVCNYINNLIGNRIKLEDGFKFLSRQTVRNIILSSKLSLVRNTVKEDIENLYIIADEKWIHTQNNNKQDVMQKAMVIFEDIKNHRLTNKQVFSSLNSNYLHNTLDYINDSYNVDNIKNIFIMGDGASWIKSLRNDFKFHKNLNVIYALDKFHFKQAIHHICLEKNLEPFLTSYVLGNNKDSFNELCQILINNNLHRTDTIFKNQSYILNNWSFINNLYNYNLSCPMESQISHVLADLFTSRPKAYSINMINKLTELRLLFKNNFNIKKLFLNNFNSNNILTINYEHLNFNIFNTSTQNNVSKLIPDFVYPIPFDQSCSGFIY